MQLSKNTDIVQSALKNQSFDFQVAELAADAMHAVFRLKGADLEKLTGGKVIAVKKP